MKSRSTDHTAPYAADCVAAAQVNTPRLLASGVLFVALLAAMTFVEAPVASGDVRAHIAPDPLPTASSTAADGSPAPITCSDAWAGVRTIMSVHSARPGAAPSCAGGRRTETALGDARADS
jgi:hypothetical protein